MSLCVVVGRTSEDVVPLVGLELAYMAHEGLEGLFQLCHGFVDLLLGWAGRAYTALGFRDGVGKCIDRLFAVNVAQAVVISADN